jgi:GTPase-associated protein 1, N-terminal domain type 2/GTPase-associated protein 1, middle domain
MTGAAFDRLLYTDCRAGEGRSGGGGFQVQAQSAGVDVAQTDMAMRWLLYDAPSTWITQRRPVEEFPLGFAHACVAGYGTAQSRYVGTEATGGRQGNHLADCLLTRDPGLYGPTRPAQLWRSQLWRSRAWDTTECPQFDDSPPLGPLTVEAVADWLRGSPARVPVLARVVSLLEEPGSRRVIITADDPEEAMRWIAAATMLLPIRAALEVSFKVFAPNPLQADHSIVAVPKELNAQEVPGQAGSAFVLDAEAAISDEADVTERARFWAGLLASAEDPYDVVDAVELAAVLAGGREGDTADARVAAWAVTAADGRPDDPAALARWLSQASPALLREHGAAVTGRVLAADPDADTLRWIDTAAAMGHVAADRHSVRAMLLTAEIAEVKAGLSPHTEVLPGIDADESALRDADSELSSAIVLCSDSQVDLLLRLSTRHRVTPQLGPLLERLSDFTIGWLDKPAPEYRPDDWALREAILDLAADELHQRIRNDDAGQVIGTVERVWRYFADRPGDPADPLYCQFQAAAIRELRNQPRASRLSALVQQAVNGTRPAESMSAIQQALMDWQALSPADALVISSSVPSTLPIAPEVIDTALDAIDCAAAQPTAGVLDALSMLHRRGLVPREQPFTGLLAADRVVREFVRATTTDRFLTDSDWYRRLFRQLADADPAVINARLGCLLRACLDLASPGLGSRVITVLPAPLPRLLIDRWGSELRRGRAVRDVIEGIYWHESATLPDDLRARVAAAIDRFLSAFTPAERDQWFIEVRDKIAPEYIGAWTRLAGYKVVRPRRGRRARGKD